ncbi:hypothetical protein Prum_012320 [Phytohabitans rumicis]|uniref:Uncharacterized protein n=1 Tax=Phytohabitans rumicis TaxID=1076125 RepID=A0A6V8KW30_9ACTN|nr:hypothetical protein Prum_012320 [Phytohabitans rumicis]
MTGPSYNGTPVHRIRTGDLNRAMRDLLKRRAYAEKQMTKAWGTADTSVMREAREGWRPVIRACDEDLAIISRELERRRSRRSEPTAG